MHSRLRTGSSQVSLWKLPEELLLCILKSLHIKDVLNMRAVNSIFRDMIDDCSAVWKAASFQFTWPSPKNIHYFEKAADFGNMEALIKMALAYLYHEGMPLGEDWKDDVNKAAEWFCQIEAMTPFEPFTWLFIRPPLFSFSMQPFPDITYIVMDKFSHYTQESSIQDTKNVNVCVAKTLLFTSDKVLHSLIGKESDVFLRNARQLGSGGAAFSLWQMEYNSIVSADRAWTLESIQQLREIARMGHLDSKLLLCKMYANGEYGGITPKQAAMFVRELAQSTTPAKTQECFKTSQEFAISIRYLVVDSLAAITDETNFSSLTLHTAVSLVDRYLKCHEIRRSEIRLLGLSAMVLSSSFLEKDPFYIDAAVELTGCRFRFHEPSFLRMMGEITATLKGNIRVLNSLDFVKIFSSVAELDKKCSCLAEYVCELTLLHAEIGQYSPAEIAASSVLLARLLMKLDVPWPEKMVEFSGFTFKDIRRCVSHMHEKCLLGPVLYPWDIQNVKARYAEEKFQKVSETPIMSHKDLCDKLGITGCQRTECRGQVPQSQ